MIKVTVQYQRSNADDSPSTASYNVDTYDHVVAIIAASATFLINHGTCSVTAINTIVDSSVLPPIYHNNVPSMMAS